MSDEHPIGVALENRLMSNGIYVTSVTWLDEATTDRQVDRDEQRRRPPDGVGLAIEYETVTDASAITTQDVSAVVRSLLSIADEREWTPGRFEATVADTDGNRQGQWYVDRAWFEDLGTELSELEFSERVLNTRERLPAEK